MALVTFVMGAGASAPFLSIGGKALSTRLIAEELRNDGRWRNIWRKFETERSGRAKVETPDCVDLDEVLRLRDRALASLGKNFTADNFEYLIHPMDKASFYLASANDSEVLQLDACLLAVSPGLRAHFPNTQPAGWKSVPWLVREVLFSVVLDCWQELGADQARQTQVFDLHARFFYSILKKYGKARLYTLNYDPLLIEALHPHGAYRSGHDQDGTFHPEAFGAWPGAIAPLHGHVGLIPAGFFRGNYNYAQDFRIKLIVNYDEGGWGMKGAHASTYMVTGLDKLDPFTLQPFATYLQTLAVDLNNSDLIVVIGMSFGDDHLRALLTSTLRRRPNQRVVVVDWKTGAQLRANPHSVLDVLTITEGMLEGGDVARAVDALATDVDARGHGPLTRTIDFFGGGTERFYREAYAGRLV